MEGKSVKKVVLVIGFSQTVVHKDLVPKTRLKRDYWVCSQRRSVVSPHRDCNQGDDGQLINVEAGISEMLPVNVLLGMNF